MKALMLIAAILVPGVAWAEGWVLISPPFEVKGKEVIHHVAPVGQWDQVGAFDSARECEDIRMSLAKNAEEDKSLTAQASKIGRCMPYSLWWQSEQSSRCEK